MKFIVSSSTLYKELQTLGGIINSTNTIPILDNFLFEVDNNNLKISSSDLESTMTSEIDIESQSTDKIACLLYTSASPRDLSTSRMPSSA